MNGVQVVLTPDGKVVIFVFGSPVGMSITPAVTPPRSKRGQ